MEKADEDENKVVEDNEEKTSEDEEYEVMVAVGDRMDGEAGLVSLMVLMW